MISQGSAVGLRRWVWPGRSRSHRSTSPCSAPCLGRNLSIPTWPWRQSKRMKLSHLRALVFMMNTVEKWLNHQPLTMAWPAIDGSPINGVNDETILTMMLMIVTAMNQPLSMRMLSHGHGMSCNQLGSAQGPAHRTHHHHESLLQRVQGDNGHLDSHNMEYLKRLDLTKEKL